MSVGDGNINGQFFVKKGQGLSQAIAEELNLKPDEIKQIDGKTWKSIFQKVDEQQQKNIEEEKGKVYTGGNTWNGSGTGNYVVQVNQAVSFSKEIWADIVDLVSAKLGKEIKIGEQDENFGATNTQGNRGAQNANGTEDSGATDTPEEVVAEEMEQQIKADAEKVKVNVAGGVKEEAKELAGKLKKELQSNWVNIQNAKNLLTWITPDNVAYVLQEYSSLIVDINDVDRLGAGFDKNEVIQYILTPMIKKFENLGDPMTDKNGVKITPQNAKSLSLNDLIIKINEYATLLIQKMEEKGFSETQQVFDNANATLAEAANMQSGLVIKDQKTEDGKSFKSCTLPDGRTFIAYYDNAGEIEDIKISYDTGTSVNKDDKSCDPYEVSYTKGVAYYNNDNSNDVFDGFMTSGFNFEEIKALVEKVLDKGTQTEEKKVNNTTNTADAEEIKQQTKADAENVKINVANVVTQETLELVDKLKKELQSDWVNIQNARNLLGKITPDNVAYVLQEYPNLMEDINRVDRLGAGFDEAEIIQYVLTPMIKKFENLGDPMIYDDKVKITPQNAKSLSLEALILRINSYKERLFILMEEKGLAGLQQTFDDANNFLAEVANMSDKPEIETGTDDENRKWAECQLADGRRIKVFYDSNGEINTIYISHVTSPDIEDNGNTFDGWELKYTSEKASYNTDKSNDVYDGSIKSGYDFQKLKALAEKLFGKPEVTEG